MGVQDWSPSFLDSMREIGDPVTDPMIAEVLASEGEIGLIKLNDFLQTWEAPINDDVSPIVREFLEAPVVYPEWVDHDLINQASELFKDHGPQMLLILMMKSLPQYMANPIMAATFATIDLSSRGTVARFIVEVCQLIIDVLTFGNLKTEPTKANGIITLQKLRLHHSIIRHWIVSSDTLNWDPAMGVPINQEDFAGSVVAFTIYDLEGFEKVNLTLTQEEKESTLHIWKVMGFLLGMDERFQPADMAEAQVLLETISKRLYKHSSHGVDMMAELLKVIRGFIPRPFKGIPLLLMRYLMAPPFIKILEVPRPRGITWFFGLVFNMFNRQLIAIYNRIFDFAGPRVITGITKARAVRHGDRGEFRLLPQWTK